MSYCSKIWLCGGAVKIDRSIRVWNAMNISIGKNTHVFRNCILATHPNKKVQKPQLVVGENCEIGEYTHITCANKIIIGDNLLTGRRCTITDNSHGSSSYDLLEMNPRFREIESKGPVVIGKNVWLGDNVVILPNVTIGDGVIVGANSVVTKDIPSFSVAAGCPATIKKIMLK